MIFVAILTVIILWNVPRLSNIVYTPNITASRNVIQVEFESEAAFWIAKASISVNGCNGSVIVVQEKACSSVPTTETIDSVINTQALTPVYFLGGSYMNLSDIDSNDSDNTDIWILNTKDFLKSKKSDEVHIKEKCDALHECPSRDGESCCYHIQNYTGGNILHPITKSDFYFAVSSPKSWFYTFDFFYSAVVYDLDAITHLPGAKVFPSRTITKISDWFEFSSTKCILLNTTCPVSFHPIVVSNISRRMDVLVLILILEFIVLVVGTGLALLCKLTLLKGRQCHAKRSRKTYEELEPSDATALIESTSHRDRVYNVTISSTSSFRGSRST